VEASLILSAAMNTFAKLKTGFSLIQTWILIFFAIRLVGITNAPLEAGHKLEAVPDEHDRQEFL
jgi:hypothetical protein